MVEALVLYNRPEIIVLNFLSHVIDEFLFLYLLQNIFAAKGTKPEILYNKYIGAVCFGSLLIVVDLLSSNHFLWYYGTMVLLPFLYSLLLMEGKPLSKLIICLFFFALCVLFEIMAVTVANFFGNIFLNYWASLALFITRRYILKIPLFLSAKFLSRHMVKANSPYFTLFWAIMAASALVENLVFFSLKDIPLDSALRLFQILLVIVFSICIPLCFCYLIFLINQKAEENKLVLAENYEFRMHEEYFREMDSLRESLQSFRHDYKEHLFCIDGLLQQKQYGALHQYLMELHEVHEEHMLMQQFTQVKPLNILLNQKQGIATQMGVAFNAEVVMPEKCLIKAFDIATVVSNLCNNALEACAGLGNGSVSIKIHSVKAYLRITVTNTCRYDVMKINPELKTTKNDDELHGLGLSLVRKIVKRYNGLLDLKSKEDLFTATVMLLNEPGA